MRELYRCSMMPGMPAEPVSDSRLSAQDVIPACSTCQSAGGMTVQDKELLMRQIMEAGFAMDDVALFLDTHPEIRMRFAITKRSVICVTSPWLPMRGGLGR